MLFIYFCLAGSLLRRKWRFLPFVCYCSLKEMTGHSPKAFWFRHRARGRGVYDAATSLATTLRPQALLPLHRLARCRGRTCNQQGPRKTLATTLTGATTACPLRTAGGSRFDNYEGASFPSSAQCCSVMSMCSLEAAPNEGREGKVWKPGVDISVK